MDVVKRLVFVFLVACGGTVSAGGDAAVTSDAAPDVALEDASTLEAAPPVDAFADVAAPDAEAFGANCVIDDASYVCMPGSSWAWGDAATRCFNEACPLGMTCFLISGLDAGVGVCE